MFLVFLFLACSVSPDALGTSPSPSWPPPPLPPLPPQTEDDVGRIVAIAQACAATRGEGVLPLEPASIEWVDGREWLVVLVSESGDVSRETVDAGAKRCGELQVEPAPSPTLGSVTDLFEAGWTCGQELGGVGVGGTPLVRGGMGLHVARQWGHPPRPPSDWSFSIRETEVRTLPTGRDLSAGLHCGALPMD